MAFLTSRTLASGVTGEDLFHIVITGDTSQNSAGSSYKAKVNQLPGNSTGNCFSNFYVDNIYGCPDVITFQDSYQSTNTETISSASRSFGEEAVAGCRVFTISSVSSNILSISSPVDLTPAFNVFGGLAYLFIEDPPSSGIFYSKKISYSGVSYDGMSNTFNVVFYNNTLDNGAPISPTFIVDSKKINNPLADTIFGVNSHAEGFKTFSLGNNSHAQGGLNKTDGTYSFGDASHSEGVATYALGKASHAEGFGSISLAEASHAEGDGTSTYAYISHSEGYQTKTGFKKFIATGVTNGEIYLDPRYGNLISTFNSGSNTFYVETNIFSNPKLFYASGYTFDITNGNTIISLYNKTLNIGAQTYVYDIEFAYNIDAEEFDFGGSHSHSEGYDTSAQGPYSNSQGDTTFSVGDSSHAEGYYTFSVGYASHSEGDYTISLGNSSHAEGNGTITNSDYSHAEGNNTIAGGKLFNVVSIEQDIIDPNYYYLNLDSIYGNVTNQFNIFNDIIYGINYPVFGRLKPYKCSGVTYNIISGLTQISIYSEQPIYEPNPLFSFLKGQVANTNYLNSDFVNKPNFNFNSSHAEGKETKTIGEASHSEGVQTISVGTYSHAEGVVTASYGYGSHSEGYLTKSIGDYSHTEGELSISNGKASNVGGYSSRTNSDYTFVNSYKSIISDTGSTSSAILGGQNHLIDKSRWSGLFAGQNNEISGSFNSTVVGEVLITIYTALTDNSVILGGDSNLIQFQTFFEEDATFDFEENLIGQAKNSSIIGGHNNEIHGHTNSSIIGGYNNVIHFEGPTFENDTESIIGSINCGITSSTVSNIISSSNSYIKTSYQTSIVGGIGNKITTSLYSGILFGQNNTINNQFNDYTSNSVIVGGYENFITRGVQNTVIVGGTSITGENSNTVYVPDLVIKKSNSVPFSSGDTIGEVGSVTWDNDYFYVRTMSGWGRTQLIYSWP